MRARLLARLLLLAKLMAPQLAFEAAKMRRVVAALPGLDVGSARLCGHVLARQPDNDAGPVLGKKMG